MDSGDKGFTITGVAALAFLSILVVSAGSCSRANEAERTKQIAACVGAGGVWIGETAPSCVPRGAQS